MAVEIITREDLVEAMQTLRTQMASDMKRLLSETAKDEWVRGKEAMDLLGVRATKLSQMVGLGIIKTRGAGRGTKYSRKSIIEFLNQI